MTDATDVPAPSNGMIPRNLLAAFRLVIGLAQGLSLWLLIPDTYMVHWTADLGIFWEPMLLVAIGVPILLIGGAGQMRWKSLLIWAGVAAIVLASLGLHDATRIGDDTYSDRIPSPLLLVFCAPAMFIAHHLVVAADQDRRIVASYKRYFEVGWTSAAQIALAGAMIGAMWIVLFLGASLFVALGVDTLRDMIRNPLFAWPATCLTFAAAIQLTGDRTGLVTGVRTLGLVLLSWLMPVMTGFVVLFLCALPFTGLAPLWRTGWATPILLASAAAIVALVNAVYQDGDRDARQPRVLALASVVARVTVLPLVILAAISTWLRIDQYGLTPDRIAAVVATVIALVYAAGYFLSVLPPYRERRMLENTNIAAACVSIVSWLAIFSPIADPARISVDDQVARLLDGRIKTDKFDFAFLRWDAARYGLDALERLSTSEQGPDATRVAALAKDALASENPYAYAPPLSVVNRISVWPKGRELPAAFRPDRATGVPNSLNDQYGVYNDCFRSSDELCDAILIDLEKDGSEEILLINVREPPPGQPQHFWSASYIAVYRQKAEAWTLDANFDPPCRGELDALRRGEVILAPRQGHDLMINGQRLSQQRNYNDTRRCS
jgi:hypothetical protein